MGFCPSCGANNADDSVFCISCGTKLQNDTAPDQSMYTQPVQPQPAYAQPMYSQQTYAQPVQSQPVYTQPTYTTPQTGQVAGIPSRKCLAAGILSVVFSGIGLSFIFGPIAIVQASNVIKKYGKRGFAIAAIVLGAIGLLITISEVLFLLLPSFNSYRGPGSLY